MTDIQLTLEPATIERDELRVPYVLANGSDAAIYVYNLLPDRYGQLAGKPSNVPTPQLAQTCLADAHTALMLLGPVPPPPLGPQVSFFGTPKPRASKVPAGAGFAATIRAKLPLAEWSEVWMPQRDVEGLVTTEIHAVRLVAVWAREADVDWVQEDADYKGSFNIRAKATARVVAEQDLRPLGVTMLVHPKMYRFG